MLSFLSGYRGLTRCTSSCFQHLNRIDVFLQDFDVIAFCHGGIKVFLGLSLLLCDPFKMLRTLAAGKPFADESIHWRKKPLLAVYKHSWRILTLFLT